jgi:hypothetical protein
MHSADYWFRAPREEVELAAAGMIITDSLIIGLAKAELVDRDHRYAAEQEADRRA